MSQKIKMLNQETIKGNTITLHEIDNKLIRIYLTNKKGVFVLEFTFNKGMQKYAFESYDKMKENLKKSRL